MWLDTARGAKQLEGLFPVWQDAWSDRRTEYILRGALHYYVASNTPPSVDASLVLAFVALELLERLVLPDVRGSADSRVRKMLRQYDIPIEVPRGFQNLLRVKNKNHCADAPKTLAEMRHRVVHPDLAHLPTTPDDELPVPARIDAWLLVTWYIELLVLAMIGYNGAYRSRLSRERWVGEVELVPWARPLESEG
jgi:hypothetical protein